jgi:hypothetical protein
MNGKKYLRKDQRKSNNMADTNAVKQAKKFYEYVPTGTTISVEGATPDKTTG